MTHPYSSSSYFTYPSRSDFTPDSLMTEEDPRSFEHMAKRQRLHPGGGPHLHGPLTNPPPPVSNPTGGFAVPQRPMLTGPTNIQRRCPHFHAPLASLPPPVSNPTGGFAVPQRPMLAGPTNIQRRCPHFHAPLASLPPPVSNPTGGFAVPQRPMLAGPTNIQRRCPHFHAPLASLPPHASNPEHLSQEEKAASIRTETEKLILQALEGTHPQIVSNLVEAAYKKIFTYLEGVTVLLDQKKKYEEEFEQKKQELKRINKWLRIESAKRKSAVQMIPKEGLSQAENLMKGLILQAIGDADLETVVDLVSIHFTKISACVERLVVLLDQKEKCKNEIEEKKNRLTEIMAQIRNEFDKGKRAALAAQNTINTHSFHSEAIPLDALNIVN